MIGMVLSFLLIWKDVLPQLFLFVEGKGLFLVVLGPDIICWDLCGSPASPFLQTNMSPFYPSLPPFYPGVCLSSDLNRQLVRLCFFPLPPELCFFSNSRFPFLVSLVLEVPFNHFFFSHSFGASGIVFWHNARIPVVFSPVPMKITVLHPFLLRESRPFSLHISNGLSFPCLCAFPPVLPICLFNLPGPRLMILRSSTGLSPLPLSFHFHLCGPSLFFGRRIRSATAAAVFSPKYFPLAD